MRLRIGACGLAAVLLAFGQAGGGRDFKALLAARDWVGLQSAIDHSKEPAFLYRGTLGVAFHRDITRSEMWLRRVIQAAPHSAHARDAYEQLVHLYFYTGQYRRLTEVLDERQVAFPDKEMDSLGAFRGLPDQTVDHFQASVVPHERDSIEMPVSINDHSASYFFDTGAWFSVVSESEAKRLGLTIGGGSSTTHTMTSDVGFRMAVAKEVRIGSMHFRNVSFGVMPDTREPFSMLAPGHRGIIGIPVIFAFRALRWVRDGGLELGQPAGALDLAKSNLYFDNDHLVIASSFQSKKVLATLDTGAETTDLLSGFAKQFADFLRDSGKEDKREIRGVGGAQTYSAITVPEIGFRIGNVETRLRPAQVITNEAGAKCCAGNFGMDLLKQGRAFRIDFGAMKLDLESN
jgi:predicted aspartyl protease